MPEYRKHIMHVVRTGSAVGGIESGIINIANHIPAERFRVSLCAFDTQETFSQRISRKDAEYHLLPKTGSGVDWQLIGRLSRLFRRTKIDIVHSHNWATFLYAVSAAAWAGVPIIHGEHGNTFDELGATNVPKLWTKRLLGPRVDRLVAVSQAIAAEWVKYGVPLPKIAWIPNGVDVERFRPRADVKRLRRSFGMPEEGYVIGTVGRFDPIKQYAVLIEAFAQITSRRGDCHLAFLGDGPCNEELQSLAEGLGIGTRVSWLGHRCDPELFLPALDIFALPSLSEGMSNAVLEAMSSGLPVVCSDLSAHREALEQDKEGALIYPCNPQTLAEALEGLINDTDRRRALGAAARRKVVAQFNMARMIADYARLYGEVSARKNQTADPSGNAA
jgi:sugar transferase (PEP-CTERM/EpsH1 system associated)